MAIVVVVEGNMTVARQVDSYLGDRVLDRRYDLGSNIRKRDEIGESTLILHRKLLVYWNCSIHGMATVQMNTANAVGIPERLSAPMTLSITMSFLDTVVTPLL